MDKISSLPDPILCHILSFLPIHFSVTTSVLARRWRYLWTRVPNLHFDVGEYYDSWSESYNSVGSIDSLSILSDGGGERPQIEAWISTAITRNVQDLNLCDVLYPEFCFKCQTLVELTLDECTISAESGSVCLPRLKKLNLYCNLYEDCESLSNLVSGCSSLEDLVIQRYWVFCCDGMACCYICSPTLKSLVLELEDVCDLSPHEHKLVLDVPAVQYLQLHDNFSSIIRAEKLSSLFEAEISFLDGSHSEVTISRWREIFQFVEKLCNTKSLTFRSAASMKLLDPILTTRFHNLTKLEFEADWHFLIELLESAYKLESLTIQQVKDELKSWREPKHLPKCLLSSLKYVSIRSFEGREDELNMVRYILRHAEVLERIEINLEIRYYAYSERKMLEQISYFPRGSQTCQLAFDKICN